MRIPQRKPGKRAGQQPDFYLTAEKLRSLSDELKRLKTVTQPRAITEVKRLSELGDFSENAEYQIAKGRLRGINRRIEELEQMIQHAVIIRPGTTSGTVSIGSMVTIELDGKEQTFTILGSVESDPVRGVISHRSPLGQALLGKRLGESFTVTLGNGIRSCKILSLR